MVSTSTPEKGLGRRRILQGTGALVIGACLPARKPMATSIRSGSLSTQSLNTFVRVGADSIVTVMIRNIEFGQGPTTGLATLVAEELDASWSQMRAALAPADPVFINEALGMQGTGGSTAMASAFMVMRRAGATARAMLVAAAARQWGVPGGEITVKEGVIEHLKSNRKGSFGEFAALAAKEEVPKDPSLKPADQWKLIGADGLRKLDSSDKSRGRTRYAMDRLLPNAVTAVIKRPPAFGAKVQSFDDTAAKAVPGVRKVVSVGTGVAVIADQTYAALRARDALRVQWDLSQAETRSSEELMSQASALARTPGIEVIKVGDPSKVFGAGYQVIEAEFEFPFLAHAPMEPLDAVFEVKGGKVEAWIGSQFPGGDRAAIAGVFGVELDAVTVNVEYAGGSFGRRGALPSMDFGTEAAKVAKAWGERSPLRLMWTRVDDIRGGFYRPLMSHRIRGSVDANGNIAGWEHVVAGGSIALGTALEDVMIQDGVDFYMVEGIREIPYNIANRRLGAHILPYGVPNLWWRSVGHSHTAYALETMIDELLVLGGKDPVQGRLELMGNAHPREAQVLRRVAELANWQGSDAGQGRARGVAVHKSYGSYVAQIIEVSQRANGMPRCEKVWCVVDCGVAVNPDIVRAQMESSIGFGLSAALFNEINIEAGGSVREANFNDYRSMRINECPEIMVDIIASTEPPSGVGEPGLPPIAPALANAWRRLTGKAIRRLPFQRTIRAST